MKKFSIARCDEPTYIKSLTVDHLHIKQHKNVLVTNPTPSSNSKGSMLYNENGYLIYKGSDGTITILGNK